MSVRITVLLDEDVDAQFTAFCQNKGFKKSTLIARLIREHLAHENALAKTGFLGKEQDAISTKKRGSVK